MSRQRHRFGRGHRHCQAGRAPAVALAPAGLEVAKVARSRPALAGRYDLLGRISEQTAGARFLLGTHQASWLWDSRVTCPLFVSRRRLARYKRLHPATSTWALDSGGFTELSTYGRWTISEREYVAEVARYQREIGQLAWAAPMDMMCEPAVIYGGVVHGKRFPGTGLSVGLHQMMTLLNYVALVNLWPEYSDLPCPFIPVLQGWTNGQYFDHAQMYRASGIDLTKLPLVGLGSVCRRQATIRASTLVSFLDMDGIRLHGFGMKTEGLASCGQRLASCDSLAWSFDARHCEPLPGCTHRNCANCMRYALAWREQLLSAMSGRGLTAQEIAA